MPSIHLNEGWHPFPAMSSMLPSAAPHSEPVANSVGINKLSGFDRDGECCGGGDGGCGHGCTPPMLPEIGRLTG